MRAQIQTTGQFGQIAARLWDLMPNGQQRLVDRGVYALHNGQSGQIVFQLHGNGYRFGEGHTGRAPASRSRRALLPEQQRHLLGAGPEPLGQAAAAGPLAGRARARRARRAPWLTGQSTDRLSSLRHPNDRTEGIRMASNGKFQGREVVIVEARPYADRPRSRGEGLLQGRPRLQPALEDLQGARRPHRDRGLRGRGRGGRLRAAVRRAGVQHRSQRLARGGPPDRDAGDDDRPPVRLRAASGQLRRRADRLGGPRRRDRRRRRAHGPHLVRGRDVRAAGARLRLLAPAARALQPRPPGDLGGDDRRQVGDPALRARRDRLALPPARGPGDRGGPLRAGDRSRSRSTATPTSPTRGSAPTPASRSWPS